MDKDIVTGTVRIGNSVKPNDTNRESLCSMNSEPSDTSEGSTIDKRIMDRWRIKCCCLKLFNALCNRVIEESKLGGLKIGVYRVTHCPFCGKDLIVGVVGRSDEYIGSWFMSGSFYDDTL